jgi:predicted nucleic acid-binding protein
LITYFDTSALLKLVVDDETRVEAIEQLWVSSTGVVCCELGYVEARSALAAARRAHRVTGPGLRLAKGDFEELWAQVEVVPVATALIHRAAELAEVTALRGYDAVHLAAALLVPVDTLASSDTQLNEAALAQGLAIASAG